MKKLRNHEYHNGCSINKSVRPLNYNKAALRAPMTRAAELKRGLNRRPRAPLLPVEVEVVEELVTVPVLVVEFPLLSAMSRKASKLLAEDSTALMAKTIPC